MDLRVVNLPEMSLNEYRAKVVDETIVTPFLRELHKYISDTKLPISMAIIGGRAADYYLGTKTSIDTDVKVCVKSIKRSNVVARIAVLLFEFLGNIKPSTRDELIAQYDPIDKSGATLPPHIEIGGGGYSDIERVLRTELKAPGDIVLPVHPNFPLCVLVLPYPGDQSYSLVQIRQRYQEGFVGPHPKYPNILDIVVKEKEEPCNMLDTIESEGLPYIDLLSLIRSQQVLLSSSAFQLGGLRYAELDTKRDRLDSLMAKYMENRVGAGGATGTGTGTGTGGGAAATGGAGGRRKNRKNTTRRRRKRKA